MGTPAALGELARRPILAGHLVRSLLERRRKIADPSGPKSAFSLCIGLGHAACDRFIVVPEIPTPGTAWTTPIAVQLSALAAQHRLDIRVQGAAALWALWLVPEWEHAVPGAELPTGAQAGN